MRVEANEAHWAETVATEQMAPRIGWLCSYTPVEILTAAGLVPVRLLGSAGADAEARAFLPAALCPYLKACLGSALAGSAGRLDGLVVAACCNGLQRLADVWARHGPGFVYTIDVPRRRDEAAVAYFRAELVALAQFVGERYDHPVGEAALCSATAAHNETRRLLGELDARRPKGPIMPAAEILAVVERSSQERPSVFNRWFAPVLSRLAVETADGPNVPVVLSGNVLAADDRRIVDLVEAAGGRVVGDDLCGGMRGVAGRVSADGDPFLALARRYLERVPCARMVDAKERYEELLRLCRRTGARGVIYASQKFCDSFLYDFGPLRDHLEQEGIRTLLLEMDGSTATIGQYRTRIEAFLEVL